MTAKSTPSHRQKHDRMIRKFFAAIGIALAMVVPLTALGARNSNLASEMVGTWKLLSYKSIRSDGSSVDLYGPAPSGQLTPLLQVGGAASRQVLIFVREE